MTACFTRSGSIEAICENIREALPERYYEQLEDDIMGYKEVKIIDYFDHLDNKWCKMDTRTRQKMRAEFYQPWDQVMHLTKFGIQLNKEQAYLETNSLSTEIGRASCWLAHGSFRDRKSHEKALVGVNVTGFTFASKYGLLVEVIEKTEFDTLSGKSYLQPPEDDPQDKNMFNKGAQRLYHNYMAACFTRSGSCEAICQNIREALPEKYYEQLEDDIMGYNEVKILDYFDRLDNRWCKMETRTSQKIRAEFYQPWDQVMHLTKFGIQLNKEQAYLKTCGINIADDVKTQFYVEQMIESGIFSKQDIIAWESDLQDKDWGDADHLVDVELGFYIVGDVDPSRF